MNASFVWPAILLFGANACRSTPKPSGWGLDVRVLGMPESERGGRAVILLHGWGAPGDDLVPLAQALARPDTRFIVPAAPLPHPYGGRAWWALDLDRMQRAARDPELMAQAVPEGLADARAKVLALIAEVRRRYQPRSVIVAGFSQGGILAMDVALHAEPPVDGVAVLSGTLLAEKVWRERLAQRKLPVFLSHGRHDDVLPFSMSERLKTLLEQQGVPLTWVPFDDGHTIPPLVVQALARFLTSGS
jgi:phospholipase/carboxylesterase